MKVKILGTGVVVEHNDSYGMRLIEQGKAVIAPQPDEAESCKPAEPVVDQPAQPAKPGKKR